MNIKSKIIKTDNFITKSNLPFCDYVINPYVGCTHACKYCYASFMRRFTGHDEEWGTFIDIKECDKKIDYSKLTGKTIFLSSVTDPYNSYEGKYKLTRNILESLIEINCKIKISTKSSLVLRDVDLLKQLNNVQVAMSVDTLDEKFKKDMDNASPIKIRLKTLKELHDNGISTVLFMSPIFPKITNFKKIIEETKDYIDEYWFENLNLRGSYKKTILDYINEKYPQYNDLYNQIFNKSDYTYWEDLERKIINYCDKNNIKYVNAFYHKKLVDAKKSKN